MSRRIVFGIALATVLTLVFAGFAWAQTPAATTVPTATVEATSTATVGCPSGNFVDNDGDGVCDYRNADSGQAHGPMGRMGNMMGGMMGGMMRGMGQSDMGQGSMMRGQNYVDADQDGVCDHNAAGTGQQRGQSAQRGMGMGHMGGNGMNQGMGRGWHE